VGGYELELLLLRAFLATSTPTIIPIIARMITKQILPFLRAARAHNTALSVGISFRIKYTWHIPSFRGSENCLFQVSVDFPGCSDCSADSSIVTEYSLSLQLRVFQFQASAASTGTHTPQFPPSSYYWTGPFLARTTEVEGHSGTGEAGRRGWGDGKVRVEMR